MKKVKPICLWFTGLSGAGKTTLGLELKHLFDSGELPVVMLDGDDIRQGINKELGFTVQDRTENIRRVSEISKLIINSGVNVICCFMSPTQRMRNHAKQIIGEAHFVEVFVSCPLEVCQQRDTKNLYEKALKGEIRNLSGMDSPFEIPENPDIEIDTVTFTSEKCVRNIWQFIYPLVRE